MEDLTSIRRLLKVKDERVGSAERAAVAARKHRDAARDRVAACKEELTIAEGVYRCARERVFDDPEVRRSHAHLRDRLAYSRRLYGLFSSAVTALAQQEQALAEGESGVLAAEEALRVRCREREKIGQQAMALRARSRIEEHRRQECELEEFLEMRQSRVALAAQCAQRR